MRKKALAAAATFAAALIAAVPVSAASEPPLDPVGSEPPTAEAPTTEALTTDAPLTTGDVESTDPTTTVVSTTVVPTTTDARTSTVAPSAAEAPFPSSGPVLTEAAAPMVMSADVVAPVAPSMPRVVTAVPANRSVTLSWRVPTSTGTSPISGFRISYVPAGGHWSTVNVSAGARSHIITGLVNGTTYAFRISAYSAAGTSAMTTAVKAVPFTRPSGVSRPRFGFRSCCPTIGLAWSAPSNGGSPITKYVVQVSSQGQWVTIATLPGTTLRFTTNNLVRGRTYIFRVAAGNRAGLGSFSPNASATVPPPERPATVPDAPVGLSAVSYYSGHDLDWYAPANGGSPITDYVVQLYDPDANWGYGGYVTYYDGVSTASWAWLDLFGYGCNDMRVAAINAVGVGPYSYVYSCYWG